MTKNLRLAAAFLAAALCAGAARAEDGFGRLKARLEAERLSRSNAAQAGTILNLSAPARDVLGACPELDAQYFVRRPLAEAAASVQACLGRVFPSGAVSARPGVVLASSCPGDRGLARCASLREVSGIVIRTRGRALPGDLAVEDLRYSVEIRRGGKLEGWDAAVEAEGSQAL